MNKALSLLLIVSALVVTGCSTEPTPTLDTERENETVYINTDFGFELDMTENWADYRVVEKKNPAQDASDLDSTEIEFHSPTAEDASGYSELFNLLAFDRSEWESAKETCLDQSSDPSLDCWWLMDDNVSFKNDDYVFTSGHINDFPYEDQKKAFADYDQIIQSIRVVEESQ